MKARQERDPLWYRMLSFLPEFPGWVYGLLGYLVIVPAFYWLGSSGNAATLADSPEEARIGMAIAGALGWTACLWFMKYDSD